MDEKKQAILNRIVKALALAVDRKDTPEGRNAELVAARLMAQYSITETEVKFAKAESNDSSVFHDEEGVDLVTQANGKFNYWAMCLCGVIADTFHTKMYHKRNSVHYIGSEADIETCLYFTVVLQNFVEAKAYENFPKSMAKRYDFWHGAAVSIADKLRAMKKDMEEEIQQNYQGAYALVVVKDALVEKEFNLITKDMKRTKKRAVSKNMDRDAYMKGIAEGKKASLNLGISE